LQENNRNYAKGALTLGFFKPVVGVGLLTSEGSLWLRQRRLMQPDFRGRSVAAFGTLMTEEALAMLERWQRPRQCIGESLALVEAQLVLATVLGRCRLRLVSDEPVEAEALATLRPRGGLPMIAEPA
jgi:cytochrome P450